MSELVVSMIQARDLAPTEYTGTLDSYVKIYLQPNGDKLQTKVRFVMKYAHTNKMPHLVQLGEEGKKGCDESYILKPVAVLFYSGNAAGFMVKVLVMLYLSTRGITGGQGVWYFLQA